MFCRGAITNHQPLWYNTLIVKIGENTIVAVAFAVTAVAWSTCVFAATVAVGSLPPSAHADTEVSTNVVFDAGDELGREFLLRLELNASPSNNVTVAFGADADGNGALELEEADLEVGWDCGCWFYRDRTAGATETAPRGDRRRCLSWKVLLSADRTPKSLVATDSGAAVFASAASVGMFGSGWNMVRVTARGLHDHDSLAVTRVRGVGMEVRFR